MTIIRSGLALGSDAARWGLRFYGRHLLLVAGLSLIPAIARFALVANIDRMPSWAVLLSEVVTESTRVLLVVVVLAIAFRAEPGLAGLTIRERWRRFIAGVEAAGGAFYVQFGLLAIAFGVFDLVPNALIAATVADADLAVVTAVVVAVKNPTVIAMTILWMIGVGVTLAVGAKSSTTETGVTEE